MIFISYETNKINFDNYSFLLLHGKNEGLKTKIISDLLKNKKISSNYEEKEVLDNPEIFLENLLTKSFFETEKILIIKRATDKIFNILFSVAEKNLEDIKILIDSDNLEKKSKLRTFFEKDKNSICIPIYADNDQTLSKIAYDFVREKKLQISSLSINQIINKSNGERKILQRELEKLENYSRGGKKITPEIVTQLTNLIENHTITELINNCLASNEHKTIKILMENNFSKDDCILITRTFLTKLKKILVLSKNFEENKNIDLTISSAKPPIFWKEKDITKKQIISLSPNKIRKIIYKLNNIELNIKKNIDNSLYLVFDFILSQCSKKTNSLI